MKSLSRVGALLAGLSGVALHGVACDVHIDCAETQTCAEPRAADAGDAGTTDATVTADAGDPGPLTCAPGTGNCDAARFNGCEVDLTRDVNHCGACGALCEGACRDARCSALQVLATNQRHYALWGALGFDANRVYWGSSADADPNLMTWRIQSAPKAGGTVTQGPLGYSVDQLLVVDGWLFTRSKRSPAVFRLSLDASQAYPIIEVATTYAYDAGEVFWIAQSAGLYIFHKLDVGTLTKSSLGTVVADNSLHSSISVHDGTVAWANAAVIGYFRGTGGGGSILQHAGGFGRLRMDRSRAGSFIVWSDAAGLASLNVDASPPTRTSLVGGVTVLDFAISSRGDIYYAWERPAFSARGISLLRQNGDAPSLVAAACGRSLEIDGNHLYFFDCEKQRLVRLAVETP